MPLACWLAGRWSVILGTCLASLVPTCFPSFRPHASPTLPMRRNWALVTRWSLLILRKLFMHDEPTYEEAAILQHHTIKEAMEAFTILERFCVEIKGRLQGCFLGICAMHLHARIYAGVSQRIRATWAGVKASQISAQDRYPYSHWRQPVCTYQKTGQLPRLLCSRHKVIAVAGTGTRGGQSQCQAHRDACPFLMPGVEGAAHASAWRIPVKKTKRNQLDFPTVF